MSSIKSETPEKAETTKNTTKSFGIRKAELLRLQYDTPFLKGIFFFSIFLVSCCFLIDTIVRGNLQYYATSSYSKHSLFTTVKVIQSVISAVAQPTYARLSDRFGRLELTIVSIIFYVVGTLLQSQAHNINRFAAGASLYQAGVSGIIVMQQVMLADFSNLNWRLAASCIPGSSYIINTWVSGDIMKIIEAKYSWQWGIRMWSFIFTISCIPLIVCFAHMIIKARMTSEWTKLHEEQNNKRKLLYEEEYSKYSKLTLKYWRTLVLFWDLDFIGILFVIIIFGLILVPFTIAGGIKSTWAKASTIVPLVIGFISIPLFIIWEDKIARTPKYPSH